MPNVLRYWGRAARRAVAEGWSRFWKALALGGALVTFLAGVVARGLVGGEELAGERAIESALQGLIWSVVFLIAVFVVRFVTVPAAQDEEHREKIDDLQKQIGSAEKWRQDNLIGRLYTEYELTLADEMTAQLRAQLRAGTIPLPKEWAEQRLTEMGETWRRAVYWY